MRNVLFFPAACLMLMLVLFTGCEKDELLNTQDAISEGKLPESALKRNCGMAETHKALLDDPNYRNKHEALLEKVKNMPFNKMDCTSPVVLPLAFHFQGTNNTDLNCLRAMAQEQVDILNADFAGTNSDINQWVNGAASSFPGVTNGEACFRFCLADQNHPAGFGLANGDPAVTMNATTGEDDSRWSGYINIFIQPNTGLLGSAPFGGSGNGDGISIDAAAFGTGNACGNVQAEAPFTLGRTLTHEMGHYLFLDHIWGEQENCSSDDEVADTPNSSGPYDGCPMIGASTCNSVDIHMNYMDYTNDECMYMFTSGQIARATNFLNASLQEVVANAANVCGNTDGGGGTGGGGGDGGGGTTATCDDGQQNGSETGVDCGGPDCAPCDVPEQGCTRPDNLVANNVTTNAATLSWAGISDLNKFRLVYRPQGTQQWQGMRVNGNQKNVSGLNANTTYQWKVRSLCADERSAFSTLGTFTTEANTGGGGGNNDDDCTDIRLDIRLDDYGSETSWELYDDNGELVDEGGPYQDNRDGMRVGKDFCLSDGCYELVMYDDAGDGLCCDYGRGKFWLRDADGVPFYADNGRFGDYVVVDFCISADAFGRARIGNLVAKPKAIDPVKAAKASARKK